MENFGANFGENFGNFVSNFATFFGDFVQQKGGSRRAVLTKKGKIGTRTNKNGQNNRNGKRQKEGENIKMERNGREKWKGKNGKITRKNKTEKKRSDTVPATSFAKSRCVSLDICNGSPVWQAPELHSSLMVEGMYAAQRGPKHNP